MNGSPTILDIAREVGLSKTTVADALSGSGRVSERTRARINDVADQLGYVSNRAARSLRSGRNGALGVYIPAAVRELSFYMQFAFGAADRASKDGDALTLLPAPGENRRPGSPHIDGVIIVDPVPGDPECDQLLASRFPVVSVGAPVIGDGSAGTRPVAVTRIPYEDAVPAFLDEWSRGTFGSIAFITPDRTFITPWSRDIHRATSSWCASRGVLVETFELPVVPSDEDLRDVLSRVSSSDTPFSGHLFAAEMIAGRAAGILGRSARRDPLRLATLSGDPGTELTNPGIAAMDLGARRFGAYAVDFLQDVIAGKAPDDGERLFSRPRFVHT